MPNVSNILCRKEDITGVWHFVSLPFQKRVKPYASNGLRIIYTDLTCNGMRSYGVDETWSTQAFIAKYGLPDKPEKSLILIT